MIKNKKRQIILISAALLLLLIIYLLGWDAKKFRELREGEIGVYFIDTAQSDAILIKSSEGAVLIDTGDVDNGKEIVSFLRSKDVKTLNSLVITHPHSDHIGGIFEVLGNTEVGNLYMPDIPEDLIYDTVLYDETIEYSYKNGINFISADSDEEFSIGNMKFTFLSPIDSYSDVNNYSAVLKLEYQACSFLFCGDIEKEGIEKLLKSDADLSADLVKVPHHGGNMSLNSEFYLRVSPRYAVITVGENSYGHPNYNTLEALNEIGAEIYRTDKSGTVSFICDGADFEIETEN